MAKTGRNQPCPCGSGKKYKKCHGTYAVGTSEKTADRGRGLLHIEHTARVRAYDAQTLAARRTRKPVPKKERVLLADGAASSIPKEYRELGMFQRIYKCLPGLWDLEEDPLVFLFEEERYQVELRRRGVSIWETRTRWRTQEDGSTVWDVDLARKGLDPRGYYSCITVFVRSESHPEILATGTTTADSLAGLISLTMTPDLVRTPIWEATYESGGSWRVFPGTQMFRVGPPSVVPESFGAVNALASTSVAESGEMPRATALRFLANEARTEFGQDRFIWLYLSIRVIVDGYYERENPGQQPPEQEQRFRFYAAQHFPGESEIVEHFKSIYIQRNNLLKSVGGARITADDVRRAQVVCHRLLRCEVEKTDPR